MPPQTTIKEFRTEHMPLAAYLYYLDHEIISITWHNGQGYVSFKNTDDLKQAVADFWSDEAKVSPQLYNSAFGRLKQRVFANRPLSA